MVDVDPVLLKKESKPIENVVLAQLRKVSFLMVNVEPVDVIGMEVPNVPTVHVLHLLSPHGEKPTDDCVVVFECILV